MKRPYVVINCAMTADGKIAKPSGEQLKISCEEDMKRVYQMRNDVDAVLVGINTVLSDNPKLTVKEKYVKNPKQPIRIVLDSKCRTPIDALVVNNVSKTIIFTAKQSGKNYSDNVEIVICETDEQGFIDLKQMLEFLSEKGIKNLMVEGGSTIINSFLKRGLVDDFYVYVGPMIVGGNKAPSLTIGDSLNLKLLNSKKLGQGILNHYRLK